MTIFVTASPPARTVAAMLFQRLRRSRSPWWRSPSRGRAGSSRAAGARPARGGSATRRTSRLAGDPPRTSSACSEAGVTWIREDFLWDAIEPEQGRFDWRATDALMAAASEHDLDVLGDPRLLRALGELGPRQRPRRRRATRPPTRPTRVPSSERYGEGGSFWGRAVAGAPAEGRRALERAVGPLLLAPGARPGRLRAAGAPRRRGRARGRRGRRGARVGRPAPGPRRRRRAAVVRRAARRRPEACPRSSTAGACTPTRRATRDPAPGRRARLRVRPREQIRSSRAAAARCARSG